MNPAPWVDAPVTPIRRINPLAPLLPYGYNYKASCARPG